MLERIGVSLERELLRRFDDLIKGQGYSTRSEAIRDLIREALIKREWVEGTEETVGAAVLVYEYETLHLAQKLTEIEHSSFASVVSALHIHMDEKNCFEIVILRGKAKEVNKVANLLISTKGVKHGKFVAATTGKNVP